MLSYEYHLNVLCISYECLKCLTMGARINFFVWGAKFYIAVTGTSEGTESNLLGHHRRSLSQLGVCRGPQQPLALWEAFDMTWQPAVNVLDHFFSHI